jgi:hypothetical protein
MPGPRWGRRLSLSCEGGHRGARHGPPDSRRLVGVLSGSAKRAPRSARAAAHCLASTARKAIAAARDRGNTVRTPCGSERRSTGPCDTDCPAFAARNDLAGIYRRSAPALGNNGRCRIGAQPALPRSRERPRTCVALTAPWMCCMAHAAKSRREPGNCFRLVHQRRRLHRRRAALAAGWAAQSPLPRVAPGNARGQSPGRLPYRHRGRGVRQCAAALAASAPVRGHRLPRGAHHLFDLLGGSGHAVAAGAHALGTCHGPGAPGRLACAY